jgi:hypothetical protein
VALVVLCVALFSVASWSAAADKATIERAGAAARAVLADGRFQRELPGPSADDDKRDAERPPLRSDGLPPVQRTPRPPEAMGDVARVLLWGLVAVVVVLSIMFLINEAPHLRRRLFGRGSDRPDEAAGDVGTADSRRSSDGSLDAADRLARDGAYGEAIHVMLLSLVGALSRGIGRRLAHSLTGREIVGAAGLAEQPGAALARIVGVAERGHFGGRVSSVADYEACRRDYAAVVAETGPPE